MGAIPRALVLFVGCIALAAITATTHARPQPIRPNVLVILTDDQGRGDYSAFGTKDIHTPHMDRLFHEGIIFE